MLKNSARLFILSILTLLIPKTVLAVCPVCTIAVGAGIGLSRWLGIDDVITGLWIGGLLVSLTIWTEDWFTKKKFWAVKYRWLATLVVYILITLVPLYFMGVIGHPLNTLWGIDKLVLGSVLGGLVFYWAGVWAYRQWKARRGGRACFPFQKVVMPLAALLILSLIFEWLLL